MMNDGRIQSRVFRRLVRRCSNRRMTTSSCAVRSICTFDFIILHEMTTMTLRTMPATMRSTASRRFSQLPLSASGTPMTAGCLLLTNLLLRRRVTRLRQVDTELLKPQVPVAIAMNCLKQRRQWGSELGRIFFFVGGWPWPGHTHRAEPGRAVRSSVHRCLPGRRPLPTAAQLPLFVVIFVVAKSTSDDDRWNAFDAGGGSRQVRVRRMWPPLRNIVQLVSAQADPPQRRRGARPSLPALPQSLRLNAGAVDASPDARSQVSLFGVRQGVLAALAAPRSRAIAHRRKAVHVFAVWKSVCRSIQPSSTRPDTLRSQEVPLFTMPQDFRSQVLPVELVSPLSGKIIPFQVSGGSSPTWRTNLISVRRKYSNPGIWRITSYLENASHRCPEELFQSRYLEAQVLPDEAQRAGLFTGGAWHQDVDRQVMWSLDWIPRKFATITSYRLPLNVVTCSLDDAVYCNIF